jgi:branched-chain amino acid transport system substrate-binding protein
LYFSSPPGEHHEDPCTCSRRPRIAACFTSASAEEILIGVPVSLTGVYAFVGTAAVKGMQMAVDEINAGSELGAGRSIKLVIADDGSNTNQAITLVNRMANVDKVMAIAGPSASPTVLAVSPVVNQLQIPMVGIAVTPAVNKAGPWSNRVLNSPATDDRVVQLHTGQHQAQDA